MADSLSDFPRKIKFKREGDIFVKSLIKSINSSHFIWNLEVPKWIVYTWGCTTDSGGVETQIVEQKTC